MMKLLTLLLLAQFIIQVKHITVLCTSITTTPITRTNIEINHNTNGTKNIAIKTSLTTTRQIQRLVGGHMLHVTDKLVEQITPTSLANLNSNIYFRRKNQLRSRNAVRSNIFNRDELDDTLLLESDNKIDNWESGILRSSSGAGKEKLTPNNKEENKKTLSDQVAEGKYGLIQKELFEKQPPRPGILSYTNNPDVAKDNSNNYGGLKADDIWLAEDHLLVLKGGSLNKGDEIWKPIDDYEAPRRQVKIPENPKVAPPFPVQFEDNGPIQFIGNNQFPFYNPFPNESLLLFPNGAPQEGTYDNYEKNNFAGIGKTESFNDNQGYQYPPPIPSWPLNNKSNNNETFFNPFVNIAPYLNGSLSNINFTEPFDEDDPALYYPPPYSFVYKSNYTNPVPPGPLVPGIVLPPPPSFFSRLKENQTTTKTTSVTKLYRQQLRPIPTITTTSTTFNPPSVPSRDKFENNVIQTFRPYVSDPRPTQRPFITSTQNSITTLKKVIPSSQNVLSFLPKISPPENNVFNNANPIYYEYFDAREGVKRPADPYTITNVKVTELKSSVAPVYPNTVTPVYREKANRINPQSTYSAVKAYDYDKFVYITPKPEIKSNGNNDGYYQNYSYQPSQSFDEGIQTIKQTIQYYQNGQGQLSQYSTQVPRTPKAKSVYEYPFEPSIQTTQAPQQSSPVQFDPTPFKPLIQYSTPYNNQNNFKAVSYSLSTEKPTERYYSTTKSNNDNREVTYRQEQPLRISPEVPNHSTPLYLPYHHSNSYRTTTENPISYYTQKESNLFDEVTKKYFTTFGQKINSAQIDVTESIPTSTIRRKPWLTIEKQIIQEIQPRPTLSQREEGYVEVSYTRSNDGHTRNLEDGYHYDNPQNKNVDEIGKYYTYDIDDKFTKQINVLRAQLRDPQRHPTYSQFKANIGNDTYLNYRQPRPPINPNSEYIVSSGEQFHEREPYQSPIVNQYHSNRIPQQQQVPIRNFNRDTLVNYNFPLPAINPDSEYIPQQLNNHKIFRESNRQNPVIQYRLPGDQAHVYFITPREIKYSKK